jgi:peptidoglycan/LPS O-acetylase OafA/YrhL
MAKSVGLWGVGTFFVLSGVCIHLPNARKHEQAGWKLRIGPYLRRRFMRIYPPHLFALLLGIAVVAVAPSIAARADQSLIKPPTLRFFVLHLLMVHSFFADAFASINVVLWTIAIEWHFYLAYPLILWARRRVSMRTICIGLLALSLGVRVGSSHFIASAELRGTLANSIICRWWEWALGCYVAEQLLGKADGRVISRATAILVLAGGLAVAVGLTDLGRANLLFTYLGPPVFAFALFFGARISNEPHKWIDRNLVALGRESYSLYLTHPIALALATAAAMSLGLPWYVAAALMIVLALTLSRVFFSMIEYPFMCQASAMKALERGPGS